MEDEEISDMEEIYTFLETVGVTTAEIAHMKFNELTTKLMKKMTDDDLKTFMPKYAHRVALRDFLNLKLGHRRKTTLVNELRLKMGRYGEKPAESGQSYTFKKRDNVKRREKQIFLGWLMSWDGKTYVQVKEPKGGGIRRIYVPLSLDRDSILEKGLELFFPNGTCKNLKLEDFEVELFNSRHEPVERYATVESVLEATALQRLRFYVATKPKKANGNAQKEVTEIGSDDSDELVSYSNSYTLRSRRSLDVSASTVTSGGDENGSCVEPNKSFTNSYTLRSRGPLDVSASTVTSGGDGNGRCVEPNEILNFCEKPLLDQDLYRKDLNISNIGDEYTDLVNSILDEFDKDNNKSIAFLNATPHIEKCNENIPDAFNTFEDVLRTLQKPIDNDAPSNTFNVFREEAFECCVRAMRRRTFSPFSRIFVMFSDIDGTSEGAIDEGGPCRELFRIVINKIKDGPMFQGHKKKNISLDATSLTERHYYEAGRLIALSLIHGGPAPHFFSKFLFASLIGDTNVQPTLKDVDEGIEATLRELEETDNLADAQNLIVSNNVFSIAGYRFIYKIEDKPDILKGTLAFYASNLIKEALAQFVDGLKTCHVHDYLMKFPHLFEDQMCNDIIPITAKDFEKIFDIAHTAIGSNTRAIENRTITYFRDYLIDCEEKHQDENATEEGAVTLEDILIFATGADQFPPLGFLQRPQITFLHEEKSKYPKANTCSVELKLPVIHTNYKDFVDSMNFGIANCNAFGFA